MYKFDEFGDVLFVVASTGSILLSEILSKSVSDSLLSETNDFLTKVYSDVTSDWSCAYDLTCLLFKKIEDLVRIFVDLK